MANLVTDKKHAVATKSHHDPLTEGEPVPKEKPKKAPKGAPDTYEVYKNPDKTGYVGVPEKNPCQPGHPSRIIIVGKPGCGKRSVMLNMLRNYDFDFDTVTEIHASARSREHDVFQEDDFDYDLWQWDNSTDDIQNPYHKIGTPPVTRFERRNDDDTPMNHLLIMDEPPVNWSAQLQRDVGSLFNYNSTHNNVTIFLITQHMQSLPIQVRDTATHWVLFPPANMQHNSHCVRFWSRIVGAELGKLFPSFCRTKYDSIMVDLTGEGPRLRRNIYEVITDGYIKNELDFKDHKLKRKKDSDAVDEFSPAGRAERTAKRVTRKGL